MKGGFESRLGSELLSCIDFPRECKNAEFSGRLVSFWEDKSRIYAEYKDGARSEGKQFPRRSNEKKVKEGDRARSRRAIL